MEAGFPSRFRPNGAAGARERVHDVGDVIRAGVFSRRLAGRTIRAGVSSRRLAGLRTAQLGQNGVLDPNDDPRILSFKGNSGVITGGRVLYCVVELRSASGQAPIGQALIRFKICLGDVDRDGDTDGSDVGYLLGSELGSPVTCGTQGDVTGNGNVDEYDLALSQANEGCDQADN